MKIIKNSCSIIIWIGTIIIGNVVLSIKANSMGDNAKEAFGYVQKTFSQSALFWLILVLLIVMAITLNLHQFQSHIAPIIVLSALTIIISIWFFINYSNSLNNYNSMLTHMEVPEIGKSVLTYRLHGILLTILAITLSGYNIVRGYINKSKS